MLIGQGIHLTQAGWAGDVDFKDMGSNDVDPG
jgi:hypothetical protein